MYTPGMATLRKAKPRDQVNSLGFTGFTADFSQKPACLLNLNSFDWQIIVTPLVFRTHQLNKVEVYLENFKKALGILCQDYPLVSRLEAFIYNVSELQAGRPPQKQLGKDKYKLLGYPQTFCLIQNST